jgi:hypothetical protein
MVIGLGVKVKLFYSNDGKIITTFLYQRGCPEFKSNTAECSTFTC